MGFRMIGYKIKFKDYPVWMKAYYIFAIIFMAMYLAFLICDYKIEIPSWLDYTLRWGFLAIILCNIACSIIISSKSSKQVGK